MSGPSKIFTDEDDIPINFFFHSSIKKDGTKQKLKEDIEEYGGHVVEDVFTADTILVDPHYGEANRRTLERSYVTDSNPTLHKIFVEYSPFIRRCIGREAYRHANPQRQGMNGIRPGTRRQPFTEDDDERLADHIAKSIPDEKAGGRLSLNFYKDLVRMGLLNPELCGWAIRHTAESWKERYKKRREAFNRRIREIVEQNPAPTQNQLWVYDRRLNGQRVQEYDSTENEDEDQEGDTETWNEEAGQQEDEESDNRYNANSEGDEGSRPLKSRRTAMNVKARQPGHSRGSQRPVRGKGKAKAVQQELLEEDDAENTDSNAEYQELFGQEPGSSNQNLVPISPQQNRQPNIVSLQDSRVHMQNVTTESMHDEGPSRQNSPMFPGAPPWPSPIRPKMSLHPSPMQLAGPQALSSPPRYRSQPPASKAKEIPQVAPPAPPTASSKRAIPKMAARRPRAFNGLNRSSQSKTLSEDFIDIPEANSKQQKTNSTGMIDIPSTGRIEANSAAVTSRSHPSQDSIGKGRANKNSTATSQIERSHPQPVERDMRSSSMETDDAQIKGELFTNQFQSTIFQTVPLRASSPIEPPSQFLESWEASPDTASKMKSLSQQPTSGRDVQTQNRSPFTPTFNHSRARSTSTDESYPIKGTKASAYKQVQTQKAKHTPYQPLEGTRASQFTI